MTITHLYNIALLYKCVIVNIFNHTFSIILHLSNYATQADLKNLHVKTSDFALKTNLASLKGEVHKLDIDKLIPVPNDLGKLSNKVENLLKAKTDFNTLKTKVDDIDLNKYILKTKYDSEVGDLKLKIPDNSGLLQTSVFNSKITEIESKITTAKNKILDISGLASKTELTNVENKIPDIKNLVNKTELTAAENKIPDINGFVEKTNHATEISGIKTDYVTNTALTSRLNDLKTTHISDELKKVDDKVKRNSSDILSYESRLKQKEDLINDLERNASFFRGNYYYNQQIYLLFEPKSGSLDRNVSNINGWNSTGIHNDGTATDLISVANSSNALPKLLN